MKIILIFGVLVTLYSTFNSVQSKWVQWNSKNKNFPPNPVVGGINPEKRDLYVIRYLDAKEYFYGSCGGVNGESFDDCFVANDHREKQVFDVEVLTGENFVWCSGVGRDFDVNFPICRASHKPGNLESGTWRSNGSCRIGFLENSVSGVAFHENFEVLRLENCENSLQ